MQYILGIDPGLNGSLALYRDDPLDIIVLDMPINIVTINNKQKKMIDVYELARWIDSYSKDIKHVFIENVTATPQMGVTSAFSFGHSLGLIKGIIAANFLPTELIRPQKWKKFFGLNSDKSASRIKASGMFPNHAHHFTRSKDDGRAEAVLIAVYGLKNI